MKQAKDIFGEPARSQEVNDLAYELKREIARLEAKIDHVSAAIIATAKRTYFPDDLLSADECVGMTLEEAIEIIAG